MRPPLLIAFALLLIPALSSSAQQVTKEDLKEMETRLETRLREHIDLKVATVQTEIKELREHIDLKVATVQTEIKERDKSVTSQLDRVQWMVGMVGTLIVVVVTIIAIPHGIALIWERREIAELRTQMAELQRQVQALSQR